MNFRDGVWNSDLDLGSWYLSTQNIVQMLIHGTRKHDPALDELKQKFTDVGLNNNTDLVALSGKYFVTLLNSLFLPFKGLI